MHICVFKQFCIERATNKVLFYGFVNCLTWVDYDPLVHGIIVCVCPDKTYLFTSADYIYLITDTIINLSPPVDELNAWYWNPVLNVFQTTAP